MLTFERRNGGRIMIDVSIHAFRELYMNDRLEDILPWSHTVSVKAPPGALEP